MKILVVQQKMIGDVLTSTILFERIKKKYPHAELHFLINTHTFPAVENHPHVDQIVFFSPKVEQNYWELLKFLWRIKKQKYDVVIDVYGKLSSNLISIFSGAKTKIAYYKPYTSFIYTHPIKRLKTAENGLSLALENRLKLLTALDIEFMALSPKIYLSNSEKEHAKSFLQKNGIRLDNPIAMISVLGSSASKTYPKHYMAKLIEELAKVENIQILFNYIPSQKNEVEQVYKNCNTETRDKIFFDVYAKSLRDFIAVSHHCTVVVGNEGGAINMAKALGVPTFAVFSPKINKKNWLGKQELTKHFAIGIEDILDTKAREQLKPEELYEKMKPEHIVHELKAFIEKFLN